MVLDVTGETNFFDALFDENKDNGTGIRDVLEKRLGIFFHHFFVFQVERGGENQLWRPFWQQKFSHIGS